MKITRVTLSVVLPMFMFLLNGCRAGETTSDSGSGANRSAVANTNAAVATANAKDNSNQSVPAADSNRNAGETAGTPSDSANAKPTSQLIGSYESREVHSQGVVTMISKLHTTLRFYADGTYARISTVNGKTYHSDSGRFRTQPPDQLVLTILVTGIRANQKIQNPPLQKTHKYSLSPDGDELRLTSDKGSVGIFQRVTRPNSS